MSDVFVSYAHENSGFADRVVHALEAHEREVWIDKSGIEPADKFERSAFEGIERADAFVFVLSQASAGSRACRGEIEHAVSLNKRLVVVCIEERVDDADIPASVAELSWIMMRPSDDFAVGLGRLIHALDTDLEIARTHTRILVRARAWELGGRRASPLLRNEELREADTWLAAASVSSGPHPTELHRDFILAWRRAAMRRQRVIVGVSVTVAVVSLTLAAFAFIERSAAVSNQRTAQSRQLAASAEAALASDPQLSTLLALQALRVKYTTQAEGALRDALPQLQVLTQVKPRVPMLYSAFSPDGSEFVDVVPGGDVEIRSGNGRLLRTLGAPDDTNTRTSATFSPDGARVVTSDLSGGVTSWNLSTGKSTALFSVTDRSGPIAASSVAFDRTGRRLITADVGGSARIWDLAGNQIAAFAASSHAALVSAQFSPEGRRVVTASHGGVARIWDVPSGRQVGAMVEPSRAALTGATFNGDGSLVVTASEDGTARIWKAATGRLVGVLPEPSGAAITSAGFSPDGLRVVTASADGTTRLWDARTDRRLTVLVAPFRGTVDSASFAPDGRRILTAGYDGIARIWDGATRTVLAAAAAPSDLALGAAFRSDGRELVTA